MTIGAKEAGLDVLFGVEWDEDLAAVYRQNLGYHIMVADVTLWRINVMGTQEDAVSKLKQLKEERGTWHAVGIYVSRRVGGSANSWMVITNAVSRGTRKANHKLLLALGLRGKRKRFSCDVPTWMTEDEEARFRREMREAASVSTWSIRNGRALGENHES